MAVSIVILFRSFERGRKQAVVLFQAIHSFNFFSFVSSPFVSFSSLMTCGLSVRDPPIHFHFVAIFKDF